MRPPPLRDVPSRGSARRFPPLRCASPTSPRFAGSLSRDLHIPLDRCSLTSPGSLHTASPSLPMLQLASQKGRRPKPRPGGLARTELTLHHPHEGVLGRFWQFVTQSKDKDEIFFVSTAFDGSGMKPFVWPPDPSMADTAVIRLAAEQTHKWTLGE